MPLTLRTHVSFVFLLAVWLGQPLCAAPLFEDDAVIDIELTGPLGRLIDGPSTGPELPFTLRAEGVEHRIQVRLRGKSRLRVCSFPPLRLNFAAGAVEGTLFEDQDKLKLVTHCRGNERAEQDMLLEYAAYRIFNLLSDASYRVREVRISYTDTSGEGTRIGPTYGFLIESIEGLADRIAAEPVELEGISRSGVEPAQAALVYVFHYLIGNTDWSLLVAEGDDHCCHNGHLYAAESGTVLVPYDFDLSGIVNARYARPDPSLGISRVTRRLYRGYCVSPGALAAALDRIVELREAILAVPDGITGLTTRESERATKYLQSFFESAENRDRMLSGFERRCL